MYGLDHIAQALCTAFLHSIWIGALLLIVGYLMSWMLASRSATARYNFFCFLIVMFLGGFFFIFIRGLGNIHVFTTQAISSYPIITQQEGSPNSFIGSYSFEVSTAWLMIFIFKLFNTIRSLSQLHTIKERGSVAVGGEWETKLSELAESLEIKVKVALKESYRVSQPMVIGILKPVILFPVGLINHLSPSEVEAILLHELAHIRRRDFLVNVLQHVVESIFFFNPFVLRFSSMLRKEREFCCDELAIQRVDKKEYLQAILSFMQFSPGRPAGKYVVGLTGGSSLMIQRVNRIVGITKREGQGKTLALVGCILGMITFLSLTGIQSINKVTPRGIGLRAHVSGGIIYEGDIGVDLQMTKQKEVKHTAVPITIKRDTIPAGLSKDMLDNKDFMAGYRAGMNYKSGHILTGQESELKMLRERKEIGKYASSDTFINKIAPMNPALMQYKKALEAELIRRKVK